MTHRIHDYLTSRRRKKTNQPTSFWGGLRGGLLFFLLLILIFPAPTSAQGPDTPPSVSSGGTLWVQNCQPCHGGDGQGDGPSAAGIPNPLPNFADPATARQYLPAENFEVIKNGRIDNMMPPWGDQMTDAEIWDTAAYVWRLGTSFENIDAGETIYQENCAACHSESGSGDGPEAAAPMPDFTNLDEMVQKSQTDLQAGYQSGDPHQALSLNEAEVWQALDYVRTFSFAVPQRNGVLSGQVINATTGEPVGELEVTLRGFQENAEVLTLSTVADSQGRYTFEKLPTEHTTFYVVEATYKDIAYNSDEPGVFTPNSTETTLDLNIYDTTTNPEAVNVGQLHYIVNFTPNTANMVQIFILNNTGNRAYIGQNGQTFTFNLPGNAAGIEFQEEFPGSRFMATESGYTDTAPVPPHTETIIAVQYTLPVDDDTLTIEMPVTSDINAVSVMLADQGAELSSGQLQFMDSRSMQGQTFDIYGGANLNAGDTLSFRLNNLDDLDFSSVLGVPPGASLPDSQPIDQNLLLWGMIGLGGLALVLAGVVYPITRPRVAATPDDDPETQRQKLLLMLARLDETFEAGEMDEVVYRQARARAKTELARLMELNR